MKRKRAKTARRLPAIGEWVTIRGYVRCPAIVTSHLEGIEGGFTLDRRVGGFVHWNVQDIAPSAR